ncbi:MAG TPA: RecX family transcriptional regulator [Candidatus Hydrothermia bacterium]|nr:RecX family transcriptional regulator [Candidatus Hydrothermae bacterium]MDD3649458.1 RecX family transcriptional regulator [Candidatus Hydrothermia bacterium]MDD5573299.1 RecX family transcriptional regulator [Candidatus Hydrothermia bacterium]HOK22823.1 RecX family transcriptional regulator [Candidatus Hydrothermia bacterium]HOL23532.1 RecX family transcriptional regulator [Candidatus Hydrothermia bacterium]
MKDPIKYVLLLLKYRLRSESEIKMRMRAKGFKDDDIQKALDFLKNEGLMDEGLLADELKDKYFSRGLSPRRVRQLLKRTGIQERIIEETLSEEETPEEEVLRIIQRMTSGSTILDKQLVKRVFNKLRYMGYTNAEIFDMLRRNGYSLKFTDFGEE